MVKGWKPVSLNARWSYTIVKLVVMLHMVIACFLGIWWQTNCKATVYLVALNPEAPYNPSSVKTGNLVKIMQISDDNVQT